MRKDKQNFSFEKIEYLKEVKEKLNKTSWLFRWNKNQPWQKEFQKQINEILEKENSFEMEKLQFKREDFLKKVKKIDTSIEKTIEFFKNDITNAKDYYNFRYFRINREFLNFTGTLRNPNGEVKFLYKDPKIFNALIYITTKISHDQHAWYEEDLPFGEINSNEFENLTNYQKDILFNGNEKYLYTFWEFEKFSNIKLTKESFLELIDNAPKLNKTDGTFSFFDEIKYYNSEEEEIDLEEIRKNDNFVIDENDKIIVTINKNFYPFFKNVKKGFVLGSMEELLKYETLNDKKMFLFFKSFATFKEKREIVKRVDFETIAKILNVQKKYNFIKYPEKREEFYQKYILHIIDILEKNNFGLFEVKKMDKRITFKYFIDNQKFIKTIKDTKRGYVLPDIAEQYTVFAHKKIKKALKEEGFFYALELFLEGISFITNKKYYIEPKIKRNNRMKVVNEIDFSDEKRLEKITFCVFDVEKRIDLIEKKYINTIEELEDLINSFEENELEYLNYNYEDIKMEDVSSEILEEVFPEGYYSFKKEVENLELNKDFAIEELKLKEKLSKILTLIQIEEKERKEFEGKIEKIFKDEKEEEIEEVEEEKITPKENEITEVEAKTLKEETKESEVTEVEVIEKVEVETPKEQTKENETTEVEVIEKVEVETLKEETKENEATEVEVIEKAEDETTKEETKENEAIEVEVTEKSEEETEESEITEVEVMERKEQLAPVYKGRKEFNFAKTKESEFYYGDYITQTEIIMEGKPKDENGNVFFSTEEERAEFYYYLKKEVKEEMNRLSKENDRRKKIDSEETMEFEIIKAKRELEIANERLESVKEKGYVELFAEKEDVVRSKEKIYKEFLEKKEKYYQDKIKQYKYKMATSKNEIEYYANRLEEETNPKEIWELKRFIREAMYDLKDCKEVLENNGKTIDRNDPNKKIDPKEKMEKWQQDLSEQMRRTLKNKHDAEDKERVEKIRQNKREEEERKAKEAEEKAKRDKPFDYKDLSEEELEQAITFFKSKIIAENSSEYARNNAIKLLKNEYGPKGKEVADKAIKELERRKKEGFPNFEEKFSNKKEEIKQKEPKVEEKKIEIEVEDEKIDFVKKSEISNLSEEDKKVFDEIKRFTFGGAKKLDLLESKDLIHKNEKFFIINFIIEHNEGKIDDVIKQYSRMFLVDETNEAEVREFFKEVIEKKLSAEDRFSCRRAIKCWENYPKTIKKFIRYVKMAYKKWEEKIKAEEPIIQSLKEINEKMLENIEQKRKDIEYEEEMKKKDEEENANEKENEKEKK